MHADIEGRADALDQVEEAIRNRTPPSLFRGDLSQGAAAYRDLQDLRADLLPFEDLGDLKWTYQGVSRGLPYWYAVWPQRWAFGHLFTRAMGWVEGPISEHGIWGWGGPRGLGGYARTQAEAQAALESAARAIWREGWESRVRSALEKIRIEGLDPGRQ
jgi:hypothetical protein